MGTMFSIISIFALVVTIVSVCSSNSATIGITIVVQGSAALILGVAALNGYATSLAAILFGFSMFLSIFRIGLV